MNPPLRNEEDRLAIIRAIQDGTIDAIATDHAPHSKDEKAVGIEKAPNGIIGFETALKLCITNLVDKGYIDYLKLVQLISYNPSKILNINKDESYDTYENRLIYTLIDNMRNFLEIKKKSLITASSVKDVKKASYSARTKVGNENVFVEMSYSSSLNEKVGPQGEDSLENRIKRLDDDITMLANSDVIKALKKAHVARVIPPIKKTNVILKNTNFQYAMKLWDFLQNHVANDDKVIKSNKSYEENGILKDYMNSTFLLNYLAMNTLSDTAQGKAATKQAVDEITDKLVQRIVELNVDMPMSELKERIGDKIAITRYKTEASLSEVSNTFSKHIKTYLEKIENIEL